MTTPTQETRRVGAKDRAAKPKESHAGFVALYDRYLDAVYERLGGDGPKAARWRLMRSIATEMRVRGAKDVLDCAAGVGAPMVDLAAQYPGNFRIHCSDGDEEMIGELIRRADHLGVDLESLTPPRRPGQKAPDTHSALTIDWIRLDRIEGQYDYVLCRGNSLVYADTWAGKTKVANDDLIRTYLDRIAQKVRPGGHLHIDAPWTLDLSATTYNLPNGEQIWEKVTQDRDRREWWIKHTNADGQTAEYKRYSSLLTIDRVQDALDELRFEETKPFELACERESFGVIIARKPG